MDKLNLLLGWVPGVHKNSSNSSYGTISKAFGFDACGISMMIKNVVGFIPLIVYHKIYCMVSGNEE